MAAKKALDPAKELKRLFVFNKPMEERLAFLKKLDRRLPPGVAPEVAERVFRAMFVETYHHPEWAELITAQTCRAALKAYGQRNFAFFDTMASWILAAVDPAADDETLAAQLRAAWAALKRLHTPLYAHTREGIDATLAEPRWIEATQAAIAANPDDQNWSPSMVGLLLAEGSAGSIDVLIPMTLRALEAKGAELDNLNGLLARVGAETPEVNALRARLKSESDARAEESGANAFARAIGLNAKDDFSFQAQFVGVRKNGAQIFEVNVRVDAAAAQWGRMRLLWTGGRRWTQSEWTNEEEKCFSNNDPLRKLERLPGWLGDLAVARKCTFQLSASGSNLQGEAAARLKEWLQSATVPKKTGWATSRQS